MFEYRYDVYTHTKLEPNGLLNELISLLCEIGPKLCMPLCRGVDIVGCASLEMQRIAMYE